MSLEYYFKLEENRNPTLEIKTRRENAEIRLNQSVFDYAYLNNPTVAESYSYAFFDIFFEELL